jgi:hypothetical protein
MEEDIQKNDLVYYVENVNNKELRLTEVVIISGIWDGEKVVCTDKEQTTIRNKKWLTKEFPVIDRFKYKSK